MSPLARMPASYGDPAWRAPEEAFAALADEPYALLLHGGRSGRSIVYAFPRRTIEGRYGPGGFDILAAEARDALAGGGAVPALAGLFAYDLAGAFEALRREPDTLCAWPDVMLGVYAAAAVFDPQARTIQVTGEAPEAGALRAALSFPLGGADAAGPAQWRARWSEARYLEACEAAIAYVRAGDVYQVNLSQGFDVTLAKGDHPYAVFRRLAAASPAPWGAYLRLRGRAVITNSPEQFVTLRDGAAETRPIKGTRPRGATPEADAALAAELMASAKDRAENLMIVDLMRHDLARSCAAGSVRVPELCRAEPYANVHHLVSTVEGQLKPGLDAFDLIAGAFPPGSVTGAPKVRAMEIIAELEGEARGPYCGALGRIDTGGAGAALNVMIRTLSFVEDGQGWRGEARSGGAIVAESDPQAEYAETLAKASALRAAVTGTGR